ncbi:MAG TPA: sensor histidine kinase [Gaiellaceae bacterium]|nr:sensor histidine kinase [Gaiellaceae bacterium]
MTVVTAGIVAAGLGLGILAYQVQVDELRQFSSPENATAIVAVAWAFLVAGLVAWRRRPGNLLGPLMMLAAFALLLRQFRYSHDDWTFTVFFLVSEVSYALVAHSVLAYPGGRVTDRLERAFLAVGYTATLVFPLAILLAYDGTRPLRFFDPRPRESAIAVVGDAELAVAIQKAFVVFVWGVLATVFIALLIRRLVRATPVGRRLLAPLLLAAVAVALRAVFEGVFTFVERPSEILYTYLFWWQITGFIALPLALLLGLLRARLARAGVGDLVLELEDAPPRRIREALARTLRDPTLEVAFWLPEESRFVDADGRPVTLPEDDPRRGVTRLEHDGDPIAALVHDPALAQEPRLVAAAGAAARLALENARLQAETRAQLATVKESRARIVEAADDERRRIERDLHDGAQQRLVALALQLRSAQRELHPDGDVERILEESVRELQAAVEELRELARGVHPAILTEEGLAPALESLAHRTPIEVDLDVAEERLPAAVEATAYFVVCEALANVVKHARASRASVSANRLDGLLRVEVADDGVGGARAEPGSGLSGLADRVEALGGRLLVVSDEGAGTRVVGEIPCGS